MKTTKVIFKIIDDEVLAIFPNNLYNVLLYGNTMVDCYMHIGQHSACSVELIDELEDASEEQYKDLKIELEEIGYNLELKNMKKTIEIYEIIDREAEYHCGYFEGWENLKVFAEEKIDDGWDTNWVVDDLKDKESVIKFLTEEWYAEVNEIMEIDLTKYLNLN
jgi:hypothetical protein